MFLQRLDKINYHRVYTTQSLFHTFPIKIWTIYLLHILITIFGTQVFDLSVITP